MYYVVMLALLAWTAVAPVNPAWAGGNINISTGTKTVGQTWAPVTRQKAFAITLDTTQKDWPVGLVMHSAVSTDIGQSAPAGPVSHAKLESNTFAVGIHRVWQPCKRWHFSLGGGPAWVVVQSSYRPVGTGPNGQKSGLGGWVGTALYWQMADTFNLGFLASRTWATVPLGPNNSQVSFSGADLSLLIGYHWD